MLQSIEEVKKADLSVGSVINGVDNPNLLSVDSTEPIQTEVDKVVPEEDSDKSELEVKKPTEVVTKQDKTLEPDKQVAAPAEKKEEEEKEEKFEAKKVEKPEDERLDPVEKRIGKLTKKWRTAERERDHERDKRLEAEAELKKLKNEIPPTDKPLRENFEDDADYYEALADWKVESKLRAMAVDAQKRSEEDLDQQAAHMIEQELREVSESARDKYEDYYEVVFSKDLVLTKNMVETILQSDIADDLFYYLGKNPDIASDIGEMNPLKAAKELGKLEVALLKPKEEKKVEKEEKEEEKPPQKKLTQTPEPIVPVKTDGVTEKDPSKMSAKEYRAWRESQK